MKEVVLYLLLANSGGGTVHHEHGVKYENQAECRAAARQMVARNFNVKGYVCVDPKSVQATSNLNQEN